MRPGPGVQRPTRSCRPPSLLLSEPPVMAGPERELWVLAPWGSGAASVPVCVGSGRLCGVAGVRPSLEWAGSVGAVGWAVVACAVAVLGSGGLAASDGFAGVPSRLVTGGLADGAGGSGSRCAFALRGGGTVAASEGLAGGRWRLPSGGLGGSGASDRVARDPERLLSCGWVAWLGLAGVVVRLVSEGLVGVARRTASPCTFALGRCGGSGVSEGSAGGPSRLVSCGWVAWLAFDAFAVEGWGGWAASGRSVGCAWRLLSGRWVGWLDVAAGLSRSASGGLADGARGAGVLWAFAVGGRNGSAAAGG